MVDRVLERLLLSILAPDFVLATDQSAAVEPTQALRSLWSRLAAEGPDRCPVCGGVISTGLN